MWVTVPFASSIDTPPVHDFVQRAIADAGAPVPVSHYAFQHHNALKCIKDALEKAGSPDREALVDGLAGLEFGPYKGALTIGGEDHHGQLPPRLHERRVRKESDSTVRCWWNMTKTRTNK